MRKWMGTSLGLAGLAATAAFGTGIVTSALASGERGEYREHGKQYEHEHNWWGEDDSYEHREHSRIPRGAYLSVEQIVAAANRHGFTHVTKIERREGRYEVKARDDKGRTGELYLDAKTRQLIRSKWDE